MRPNLIHSDAGPGLHSMTFRTGLVRLTISGPFFCPVLSQAVPQAPRIAPTCSLAYSVLRRKRKQACLECCEKNKEKMKGDMPAGKVIKCEVNV